MQAVCQNTENIIQEIQRRQKLQEQTKGVLFVAIDGRCAAGKTTLASELVCKLTDLSGEEPGLIHMDHFFLRPQQRTPQRLATPGGNVDYERILQEVMQPLREGKAFSYRPYVCSKQALGEEIVVNPSSVVIVEGSYSCHPALWDLYQLRVFMTVEEKEQIRRIRERNGEAALKNFVEKWIPMEERYFETFDIGGRCDMMLRN